MLLEYLSKCEIPPGEQRYILLLKPFYAILYDASANCSVASFEISKEIPPLTNRHIKARRQGWVEDSVKNLLIDDQHLTSTFERGHFVPHGNWNYNKNMVLEMFVTTNAFPQLSDFNAYKDVEQFGRQELSKLYEISTHNFQIENCTRIIKVFLWMRNSSVRALIFDFPNTIETFNTLSPLEKRYGGSFIADRSTLQCLPIQYIMDDNFVFIHENPIVGRSWKRQLMNIIANDE